MNTMGNSSSNDEIDISIDLSEDHIKLPSVDPPSTIFFCDNDKNHFLLDNGVTADDDMMDDISEHTSEEKDNDECFSSIYIDLINKPSYYGMSSFENLWEQFDYHKSSMEHQMLMHNMNIVFEAKHAGSSKALNCITDDCFSLVLSFLPPYEQSNFSVMPYAQWTNISDFLFTMSIHDLFMFKRHVDHFQYWYAIIQEVNNESTSSNPKPTSNWHKITVSIILVFNKQAWLNRT